MADARRLVELGMVGPLAKELAAQITAGVGDKRRLSELGVVTRLASELATQIATPSSASSRRLAELSMVPALANEVASQIQGGGGAKVILPLHSPLVAFGDSIEAGSVATSVFNPAYFAAGGRFRVPPNGSQAVGGSTIKQFLDRDAATLGSVAQGLTLSPLAAHVHLGTNDITGYYQQADGSISGMTANARTMIDRLKAGGVQRITWDTIIPRNDATWNIHGAEYETVRVGFNTWMKAQTDIDVADLESLNPTTDCVDGLHPNRPGAYKAGAIIGPKLASMFNSASILYATPSDFGSLITVPLTGTSGGTVGTGFTGQVILGWGVATNVPSGITGTCSIGLDADGFPQQTVTWSGTPSANGVINFSRSQTYSGAIGDVLDYWGRAELIGLVGTAGFFTGSDGTVLWESGNNAFGGPPPDYTGVFRNRGVALTTTRTTSTLQQGVNLISGVPTSGTFKVSRNTFRKVA